MAPRTGRCATGPPSLVSGWAHGRHHPHDDRAGAGRCVVSMVGISEAEARRRARFVPLRKMMDDPENKDRNYLYSVTEESERAVFVVAMVIRSLGYTFELTIKRENYDPGLMLDLIACAE